MLESYGPILLPNVYGQNNGLVYLYTIFTNV